MTWAERFRRRESIRHSLWLMPLLGALAGMLLAVGRCRPVLGSRLPQRVPGFRSRDGTRLGGWGCVEWATASPA